MLTRRACLATLVLAPLVLSARRVLGVPTSEGEPEEKNQVERISQAVAGLFTSAIAEFQKTVDLSGAAKKNVDRFRDPKELAKAVSVIVDAERKNEICMESKLRAYVLLAYAACEGERPDGDLGRGSLLKPAAEAVCEAFRRPEGPKEHFGTIIKSVVKVGPNFPPKPIAPDGSKFAPNPSGGDVYVDGDWAGGTTNRIFRVLEGDREFAVKKTVELCRKRQKVEADKLVQIDC